MSEPIEWFQGLEFGKQIGLLTLVVATIGVGFQIRSYLLDRAEHVRGERRDAADLREKRAIINLEPARSQTWGAAMILGNVEHTGPKAGQHFTGFIRNAGPHLAEGIRVTGSFGGIDTQTIKAPTILPPHSAAEPIDLMVPTGSVTYAEIMDMIRGGLSLQVRIDFVDGTPAPEPLDRCFVFRLEETGGGGTNWVSHPAPCFAPPEDPTSHHT